MIGQRLKELRKRSGLSVRAVARAIGRPPSTYSTYEDAFKKPRLPIDLAHALAGVFKDRGIDEAEVLSLAGVSRDILERGLTRPPGQPTPIAPDMAHAVAGILYEALIKADIRTSGADFGDLLLAIAGETQRRTDGALDESEIRRMTRVAIASRKV